VDPRGELRLSRGQALPLDRPSGGRLGVQGVGWQLAPIRDALCYSEMAVLVFILNDSFLESLYRRLGALGQNEAETQLFTLAARDKQRHLSYGIEHLRYLLAHEPERREEMRRYLQKGEEYLAKHLAEDAPAREALAILLGGGIEHIGVGFQRLEEFRAEQIQTYLDRVEAAGLDHRASLWPALAAHLPAAAAS